MNRDRITSTVDVVSSAALVTAAAMTAPALGFAAFGVLGLLFSWRLTR